MFPHVLTALPDTSLIEAAKQMLAEQRKWLVVLDRAGKAMGLVDRQVLPKALVG
jgi:CBS domain-containing protein